MDWQVRRKTKSSIRKTRCRLKSKASRFSLLPAIGTVRIKISVLTQKFVGCRVGEDINSDNPWTYVRKEKICDHMDLHENSSEFLSIKPQILPYPEESFLIGHHTVSTDLEDEFVICLTTEAKNNVLQMIREEKAALHRKLLQSLYLVPGVWSTFGSEKEVEEYLQLNFRPIFTVKVKFYPYYTRRKLNYRFAEDTKDGYVAFQSTTFTSIHRRRISRGVQKTQQNENKLVQTNETRISVNKCTQYHFKYEPIHISDKTIHLLVNMLHRCFTEVTELIRFNEHINLFKDDILTLPNMYIHRLLNPPVNVFNFRDVEKCVGFKVSDIALNNLISGIFAASYARHIAYNIEDNCDFHSEVNKITFDDHLVIIWSFEDSVRPKLYLHAHRDVSCLSFCPYNENILVGGCNNGQVIIWDLTNKIQQDESRLFLTTKEINNRNLLTNFMKWMKYPHCRKHVFPTVISQLEHSHRSNVRQIQWIPMNHHVTKNGQMEENKKEKHMQFCTCATDDINVLIWDIMYNKCIFLPKKKAKTNAQKPAALLTDISPLKALHPIFIPQFALFIQKPVFPIVNLIMKNQAYTYEAKNPETLYNFAEKTLFSILQLAEPFTKEKEFVVTTLKGDIMKCKWVGNNFDQGQVVNTEVCSVIQFKGVHDGPIHTCQQNVASSSIVLTIGGSIFALWDTDSNNKDPIMWRKGPMRYISGIWSTQNPFGMIFIRKDSMVEFWNLLDDSKKPIKIRKRFIGIDLTAVYGSTHKRHVRKGTFSLTDLTGNIAVFAPRTSVFETRRDLVRNFKKHLYKITTPKNIMEYWVNYAKNKEISAATPDQDAGSARIETELVNIVPTETEDPKLKITEYKTKYESQIEQAMYQSLIQKKRINLDEIERNKVALHRIVKEKTTRNEKLKQKLAMKEEIYKMIANTLLPDKKKSVKKHKLTVAQKRNIDEHLKAKYLKEYYKTEQISLLYIERTKFKFTFDWNEMMKEGRRKCSILDDVLQKDAFSFSNMNQSDYEQAIADDDDKDEKS